MADSQVAIEPRVLTRKGWATRDRIIAAAAILISEGGVAGTSTADVQSAAGVSTSQLYHYFRDKQELISAVIARQTRAVLDGQQPYLGQLDSMDALREWRNVLVVSQRQVNCEGGCPLGALTGQLAELSAEYRRDLAAGFEEWESAIRNGLRTMQERGDFRRHVDPDRLALQLLAALQGGLLLTQVRRDPKSLEVALDETLDHISSLLRSRRSN